MNRAIEWCERCGALIHAYQGTPVVTDPGDATSPPDGYWLCRACAEKAEAREAAAEDAAAEAAYDRWADEQYARHGWRGDV